MVGLEVLNRIGPARPSLSNAGPRNPWAELACPYCLGGPSQRTSKKRWPCSSHGAKTSVGRARPVHRPKYVLCGLAHDGLT